MEHINNTCIRILINIDSIDSHCHININDYMYLKADNRASLRGRSCAVLEGERRRMFGPS